MRLPIQELAGLLIPAPKTPQPITRVRSASRRARCGREIARSNELRCLRVVAHYGHLRIAEIARAVWPNARYAEQLARRTVARLENRGGLLLERRNALGSASYCLTRSGAAWLELHGVEAQHTLDLSSVGGPTFLHRTLATRYLIERQLTGCQVAGEYLMLRRRLPFDIQPLTKALRKLPDGLVWQRQAGGVVKVEVVEQEAAPKARAEIERCLRAAEVVGMSLPGDVDYRIGGVVFVFDRELDHARRLLLAAQSLWGKRPTHEQATLEQRVKLVALELREPLVWVGASVTTLYDYRQARAYKTAP